METTLVDAYRKGMIDAIDILRSMAPLPYEQRLMLLEESVNERQSINT